MAKDLGLARLRFAMDTYAALKMAGSAEGSDELQRQVDQALAGARIVVEAEARGRETAEDVWKRLDADVQR